MRVRVRACTPACARAPAQLGGSTFTWKPLISSSEGATVRLTLRPSSQATSWPSASSCTYLSDTGWPTGSSALPRHTSPSVHCTVRDAWQQQVQRGSAPGARARSVRQLVPMGSGSMAACGKLAQSAGAHAHACAGMRVQACMRGRRMCRALPCCCCAHLQVQAGGRVPAPQLRHVSDDAEAARRRRAAADVRACGVGRACRCDGLPRAAAACMHRAQNRGVGGAPVAKVAVGADFKHDRHRVAQHCVRARVRAGGGVQRAWQAARGRVLCMGGARQRSGCLPTARAGSTAHATRAAPRAHTSTAQPAAAFRECTTVLSSPAGRAARVRLPRSAALARLAIYVRAHHPAAASWRHAQHTTCTARARAHAHSTHHLLAPVGWQPHGCCCSLSEPDEAPSATSG